jgi:hypothetical protein
MDQKSSGVDQNRTPESGRHSGTTLTDATRDWPTPRTVTGGAESQERKQELGRTKSGGGDLQAAAKLWPTPAHRDYKGANSEEHCTETGAGRKHMDQLPNFVEHKVGPWQKGEYPTPSATRYGTSQNEGEVPHERPSAGTPSLETWASSPPDPATDENGEKSSRSLHTSPRRLNPAFVSWLMGYPWYWMRAEPISSAARETRLWLLRLSSLSDSFFNG